MTCLSSPLPLFTLRCRVRRPHRHRGGHGALPPLHWRGGRGPVREACPLPDAEPHLAGGWRPINALVDITNYVMLATGPAPPTPLIPTTLPGISSSAGPQNGEKLSYSTARELALSADDLVIADEAGWWALQASWAARPVLPSTDKVILEIANFQAAGVRRTALRYDNAPRRPPAMKKGIDPSAATRPCPWP